MSDKSLRDALHELRSDLDRSYPARAPYDIPSTVIDRLDALLAARPAEPAPVDTDEAVTRVALALADEVRTWPPDSGLPYNSAAGVGPTFQLLARVAVETGAPLLGPRPLLDRETAIEAAAKARYYENADYDTPPWEEMSEDSHEGWRDGVRIAVDAVLALLNGDQS